MNYVEEINYRSEILARVRCGQKISSKDRLWLATHRIVNRSLGYPYLNMDIINLCANVDYRIIVKVERLDYLGEIYPVFTVPGGKGEITSNGPLTDLKGNTTLGKPVKMLCLQIDTNNQEMEFFYRSSLGLLDVSYQCDYFDNTQQFMVRKNSRTGDPCFAMYYETLADNKITYYCKDPTGGSFESFVFSVEWGQGDSLKGQGDGVPVSLLHL